MTQTSADIATITYNLEPGTYTFKVLTRDVWYGNYGTIEDTTEKTSEIGWEMVDGYGDCTLIATGGAYTFEYNTSTKMLRVLHVPDRFTVTFANYDGYVLKTEVVMKGESATAPDAPEKEGNAQYSYIFSGWDKDFSNITENITVTATFTEVVNKYTVTFKNWDGEVLKTEKVPYGSSATAPATPEKESDAENAYVFVGWDKDFSNVTEDITVTAKFSSTKNSYTVTFVNYDGEVLSTQSVLYGNSAIAPSAPTKPADAKYTYTFSGWDTDFTSIKTDITVKALFDATLNKYTVTFVDFDGTVLKTESVEYGKSATAPENPVRDGYEFAGWDIDFSNITETTTVTATYVDTTVYLLGSFNDWQQNIIMTSQSGDIVSATVELDEGTYIFKILTCGIWYGNSGTIEDTTLKTSQIGWEMSGDATDCTLMASGGIYTFNFNTSTRMLEILYDNNRYTVTFVDFDGTELKTEIVKRGNAATAPEAPSRAGDVQYSFVFSGWDKDFSDVQSDLTITATYTQVTNKYKVTFLDWDGSVLKEEDVPYGSAATAPADPTREDDSANTYVFAGWDKDFSNITGELTVSAQYTTTANSYKVTFVNYDDTVIEIQYVEYGLPATAPATPTKPSTAQHSYTFIGWDTDFSRVTEDITVKALYKEDLNKFTVTFVNYNGVVLKTENVSYGSAATAPANPARPSTSQYIFTFDGWDTDFSSVTSDLTVKATYTASVNPNGGSLDVYNLAEEIQKGQILQCWNWSYNNIKANLQNIASQGFSAIQTSPIQATKETTREYYNTVWNSSWVVYQPVSFNIETNSFNALGTKAEFESMCAEAEKYGIKVIVDTIFNHTANDMDGNTIHPWVPSEIKDNPDCWHDISKNIYNFDDRYEVTHHCLTGLPDLNTANPIVQDYCISFMKEAIDAGADGFRFDAAKHIETDWDADGVKSDFWYTVLGEATNYAQTTKKFTPYYYGEFIGGPTGVGIDAYTRYMSVTDTGANDIRYAVANGNAAAAANSGITYGEAPSKAVLWTESHDNYKDDGTRFISDHNINKTWAIVGSRAEVCGLYLARPSNIDTTLMGAADITSWSYPEVKAVNQFKNHFVGQSEYLASYNNLVTVERGNSGIVIVNTGGTYYNDMQAPVHTMAAGLYTDAITGNTFTVSEGYISGDIGDTGIAVVYHVEDNGPFTAGNPTDVYLVGSFNNWDTTSHAFVGEDKTTASTTVFLNAGTYSFKLTTNTGLWYGNSGTITDSTGSTPWTMYANVSDNCTLNASGGRYTFTFDSTTGKLTVTHDSSFDRSSPIYLKGSFNGWGTDNQMKYTGSQNIVSTTVKLEAGTYTFKLNNTEVAVWYGNSGTIYDTTTTTAGSGWIMETDIGDNCTLAATGGTYTFNFNLSTNELMVLHEVPEFTVTFVDWNGTVLSTQKVKAGESATAPTAPSRAEDAQYVYTFSGWDNDFTNITADTTVKAVYSTTAKTYLVTFLGFDGEVLKTEYVEYGKSATAPEIPVVEGYAFAGWDKEFKNITEETTITAKFEQVAVYLLGSFNNWENDVAMAKTEGDVVSMTITLEEGEYYFKLLHNGEWFGNAGVIEDTTLNTSDSGWEMILDAEDCTLKAFGGKYTFNYNTSTHTLEVLYEIATYEVEFVDFDGTVIKTETVEKGKSAIAPEDPVRAGYVFTGWDKDFSVISENITVTATYIKEKVTYTVTFLDFDGTVLSTQIITTGESAEAPVVPEREGYAFIGWDKEFTDVTQNLTVTALYEDIRVYLVGSFNSWATDTVMKVTEDGDIVSVELTLKPGEHFFKILYKGKWFTNTGVIEDTTLATSEIGWEMVDDSSLGNCTLNTTGGKYTFNFNTSTNFLEVVYTPLEFTVTFTDFDGTVLKTEAVKYGASATAPEAPERDGYLFSQWDTDFSSIEADLTVTAVYVKNDTEFTVTFVDFDGTVISTQQVVYGESATAPVEPSREGYIFSGWDKDFDEVKSDLTVTAQYKDNSVYLYGSFNDWAEGMKMTLSENSDVVTYELTLMEGEYFFKLLNLDNWYGNTGTIADTTLTTSDIGWEMVIDSDNCTLKASGGKYTFNFNTSTKMLEVIYTPVEYTVEFVGFDSEVISTQTVKLGADAVAPEAPEVEGYIFSGWDVSFEDITADTVVTAVYLKDTTKFTVTFVDFDGSVIETQEVEYGLSATSPADPVRVGYIFLGWDKDFSKITANTTITAQYKDNQIYLVGSFNEWGTDIHLTREDDTNYFSAKVNLEAGSYYFKLLQNDVWYTSASTILDTTTVTSDTGIELRTDATLGDTILNATGGTYTFRFNVLTNELEVYYTALDTFTVTFVDYDGTVLSAQDVVSGESATAPANPTRAGDAQFSYIFAGWDKDFTNVTEDITVTAIYTQVVNTYTVTFTDSDGTVIDTQQVEYGSAATEPEVPVKDGFVFNGWDKEFSNITEDITVTAQYVEGYRSSVSLAGTFNGWNSAANYFLVTTNSDKVTLQLKLDEGTYQFKVVDNGNWYGNWGTIADTTITTSDVGWEMDASAGDCTLIAGGGTYIFTYTISTHMLEVEYVGSEFKVTFVDWDGTVLKTEIVQPGGSATAPDVTLTRPEDEGYTYVFSGWDMDFTNVIAPLRVTAVYKATPKMYTVTFKNYNGTVLKTQQVAYGTAATPPADPVRTDYIFTGWDGDINYITGDTTFTAQYTDNGVYIMGDFNDWQGTKLTHIGDNVYQGKIYLSAGQYKFKIKKGYDWFGNNGWIDDTTTYTSDTGWEMSWDAGDCTLNASGSTYTFRYNANTRMLEVLYVAPTYTVTFKNYNGAVLKTQYVKRGNPAYAPANPVREGYIFTGWDRDFSWIYENTVVTAQFALNTVSVMGDFNNWEGTGMAPAGGDIYTTTVDLAAGTYKFKIKHADTWYGNGGTIENSTLATSDVGWEMVWDQGDCTLNATGGTYTFRFNTSTRMLEIFYQGPTFTVTFLDWDGSIISTQRVEYGKSATAPAAPEREGYTFSGWSADFSFITGNATIMAQYGDEAVYLRGTFNNWELSSPMKGTDTPKVYTYVMNLTAGTYIFKVYTADLWYGNDGTIEDTTVITSANGWDMSTSSGDCTLNAQGGTYLFRFNTETLKLEILRVEDNVTVTFADYDGTVIETQTIPYGSSAVAPAAPDRKGYAFVGWDMALDNITESVTITALYRKTVMLNGTFIDKSGVEMTLTEGTIYETTVEIVKGEHRFVISNGADVYATDSTFADSVAGMILGVSESYCTIIASGGTYKFSFNTETNELTVDKIQDATADEVTHEITWNESENVEIITDSDLSAIADGSALVFGIELKDKR